MRTFPLNMPLNQQFPYHEKSHESFPAISPLMLIPRVPSREATQTGAQ